MCIYIHIYMCTSRYGHVEALNGGTNRILLVYYAKHATISPVYPSAFCSDAQKCSPTFCLNAFSYNCIISFILISFGFANCSVGVLLPACQCLPLPDITTKTCFKVNTVVFLCLMKGYSHLRFTFIQNLYIYYSLFLTFCIKSMLVCCSFESI